MSKVTEARERYQTLKSELRKAQAELPGLAQAAAEAFVAGKPMSGKLSEVRDRLEVIGGAIVIAKANLATAREDEHKAEAASLAKTALGAKAELEALAGVLHGHLTAALLAAEATLPLQSVMNKAGLGYVAMHPELRKVLAWHVAKLETKYPTACGVEPGPSWAEQNIARIEGAIGCREQALSETLPSARKANPLREEEYRRQERITRDELRVLKAELKAAKAKVKA